MKPVIILAALAIPVLAIAAAAPAPTVTPVMRTSTTVVGQALTAPPPGFDVAAVRTVIPPGAAITAHKHDYPRYTYVISGHIRLTDEETHQSYDYGPGQAIVEPIGRWHSGRVIGAEPVELIAFDQAPAGQGNVVRR